MHTNIITFMRHEVFHEAEEDSVLRSVVGEVILLRLTEAEACIMLEERTGGEAEQPQWLHEIKVAME
jgi:hypothetical protein